MTSTLNFQDTTPSCNMPPQSGEGCHFLVHRSQTTIRPAVEPLSPALRLVSSPISYAIDVQGKGAHTAGLSKLRSESLQFPTWFDELDMVDIDCCSLDEFEALFVSAPSQFTQGMLYGKLTLRIHNSAITGRDYSGDRRSPSADMRELIRSIDARLIALKETFQEWFDQFDHVDPDFCARIELEEMILSAPISFVEGILFGKLATRIQMTALSGRAFSI